LFTGAKVKYNPAYVVTLGDPSGFTVLDPGASLNVTHDLSTTTTFFTPTFLTMIPSFLVALILSAVAVSAAPGLSVKTLTPNVNVDGLENLKVTTTVVNTGDKPLKLLKDPRGVLNPFPENSFTVTGADGAHPLFTGAKVKYNPAYVVTLGDPSGFTVLDPGASLNVTHDLSAAYNFTQSGSGDYTVEPSNLFTYVDADGTPKELYATVDDVAQFKLSGNLAVSHDHDKRATFVSCSAARRTLINTAAASAQTYTNNAYSYLVGLSSGRPRYRTWFGTYTASRKSTVQTHFRLIRSHPFSTFTYDCSCTDPNTYAYVYPNTFGRIYLCGAFWNAPNTGTDSRAGTLIHESSHFTVHGGTDDWAYGQSTCRSLAISNPLRAIDNADSHEYFAENTPAQL
jgi:peptidyl-Lys metalloendopeptidase